MKRIVYARPDGGVSVVIPAEAARLAEESDDAFLARIVASDVPADSSNVRIVEEADIPSDRAFRNAWKADLTVDLPKAREITKDRLRVERAPLLSDLDVQFMRALEAGGDTTAIAAEKQRLRDVTALADATATLDDLRSIKASTK